ncbi:hypothetical protein ACQ4PT_027383 [Festuca glaucescens]
MMTITVPSTINQIPQLKCGKSENATVVPTVDLKATGAAAAVVAACRAVGFFRATNHGMPAGLADALESGAAAFFALPEKDKLEHLHESDSPFGYGSKSIGSKGDVGWLEYLLLAVGSSSVMAVGLGLDRDALRGMVVGKEGSDEMVRVNHYPACPLASGATGFGEHTDPQILSVLRSNLHRGPPDHASRRPLGPCGT